VTGLSIKPALFAGFLLGASIPAIGQDYVDVEAERRAAAEQIAPVSGAESADDVAPETSYTGIKPYSGSTTVAQPMVEPDSAPVTGTDSGSLILRVQQLESDVRQLNGLLEEAMQALRELEAQSLERYVDLDRRMAAGAPLAQADGENGAVSGVDTGAPPQSASTNVAVPPRSVEAQEGEEAAYRAAYELVKGREFDDAVAAFNEFLSDYPFGRYAPNAHYWLGELYLVVEPPDPELARQNFKLLLDQYPADPKVPDALYKLGRVQFIKGNRQRSQEYLDEVIREYPSHAAAQLARQFLLENF
jgi:tol-pal system protein YbgF